MCVASALFIGCEDDETNLSIVLYTTWKVIKMLPFQFHTAQSNFWRQTMWISRVFPCLFLPHFILNPTKYEYVVSSSCFSFHHIQPPKCGFQIYRQKMLYNWAIHKLWWKCYRSTHFRKWVMGISLSRFTENNIPFIHMYVSLSHIYYAMCRIFFFFADIVVSLIPLYSYCCI